MGKDTTDWELLKKLRGKRVVIKRRSDGVLFSGLLNEKDDWLVGCPTVKLDNGEHLDIGYYHDLVGPAKNDN